MRNLKKILAMVLALIMSLSLMATAGAVDFKDAEAVEASNYRQAIEVLNGLGVFNGDQNGNFNPEAPITRAEVAAIIYRITTGDVNGDGKDSYSVYDNQFTDVKDTDWFAGYVSYCHNAGYVKGHADKTFGPNNPVTGYQALAMILRAVGYDKNNEFVGDNWQINTASRATTEGVLDNVKGEPLGTDAARQLVAEVLFRSILLNNVEWNIVNQDYKKLDSRVCDVLGLKEITGIVLANADADLNTEDDIDVKATQTTLLVKEVKGDKINTEQVTLNIASDLEAIGEMRTAYVTRTPNRATFEPVVNTLYEVDSVTSDNEYKTTNIGTVAGDVDVINATEKYIDYDLAENPEYSSNGIRIRYVLGYVNKEDAEAQAKANPTVAKVADSYVVQVESSNQNQYPGQAVGNWVFDRVIHINKVLTAGDYENLYYIFDNADRYNTPTGDMQKVQHGEVYVGTASVTDVSDTMKWSRFEEEYLTKDITRSFSMEPGNYVKVIDADNDGVADYALKREYYLDRVSSIYNDKIYYENFYSGEGNAWTSRYEFKGVVDFGDAKVEDGDVILRNFIDGVWYGEIVEPVTVTINKVDFKNKTVYDTEGNSYTASGIALACDMDYDIMAMSEKVEYNLYLDKGGYIRAYELAQGSQYALLTEMYPTGRNNGAFVTNDNWIVELMRVSDSYPAEYSLLNSYYANRVMNEFIDDQRNNTPFNVNNNTVVSGIYKDYLQQAIGHLTPSLVDTDAKLAGEGNGDEFDWDNVANTDKNQSWTNVGKYVMSENGVTVSTATEIATVNGQQLFYAWVDGVNGGAANGIVENSEKLDVLNLKNTNSLYKGQKVTLAQWTSYVNGLKETNLALYNKLHNVAINGKTYEYAPLQPVYAVDYIKLDADSSIAAGAQHYTIADKNTETLAHGIDGAHYRTLNNGYVNAIDSTEFYLVGENSIRSFTGFKNMPAIDQKSIRAAYAVAENTSRDATSNDYWVAKVVVIELKGAYAFDSISLAYYNPYQQTAQVQALDTLNNESADPRLEIRPQSLTWGAQWTDVGFYGLVGETRNDGYSTSNTIVKIEGLKPDGTGYSYNANKIFAGTIARKTSLVKGGNYFDIYTDTNKTNTKAIALPNTVPFYFLSGSSVVGPVNIVDNSIAVGHDIIYVYNSAGQIAYAVDLIDGSMDRNGNSWGTYRLGADWARIMLEQNPAEKPEKTVSFELALTGSEGIRIYAADGTTPINETLDKSTWTAAANHAEFNVSGDTNIVTVVIEPINNAVIGAVVANDPWVRLSQETDTATGRVTVKLVDKTIKVARAGDDNRVMGTIYSVSKIAAIVIEAGGITTIDNATTAARAQKLLDELKAIQENKVDNLPADAATNLNNTTDTLNNTINATKMTTIIFSNPDVVKALDSNVVMGESVSKDIQIKAGYSAAVGGGYRIEKKGDQSGVTAGYVIWTLTSEGTVAGSATANVTITADTTTATLSNGGDSNITLSANTVNCLAGEGTFTFTVTERYENVSATVTKSGVVAGASVAFTKGATSNGKTTYTGKVTGIYEDGTTITISASIPVALQIGMYTDDANVTLPTSNVVDVDADGNATLTFQVADGYVPTVTLSTGSFDVGASVKGETADGKTTWTCAVTNTTVTGKVNITVNAVATLTAGANVTLDASKATATAVSGTATFTNAITLAAGYVPAPITGVTFTAGTANADGSVPYTVAITGVTAPKTVNITAENLLDLLSVVPANLTGYTDESVPQGTQATTYGVTLDKATKTITIKATGLKKHANSGGTEAYWVGVGVSTLATAYGNPEYVWGWSDNATSKPNTDEQTTNNVQYDTFYWGRLAGWTADSKDGKLAVTYMGATVEFTVKFDIAYVTETPAA